MLLLTGALVAPYFVDWTNYRADFETAASKVLGREVRVAGKASARLLPFPSVTFENVRVGDDIENPVMTIGKFSMDAELAPFLKGEVLIFDMRIENPRVLVSIAENGAVDWTLRPAAPSAVETVTLENVNITGGVIDIEDESAGKRVTVEAVNARISAKALTGPWRFDGSLEADGEKLAVSGSTGALDADKKMSLRLSLNPVERSVVMETDGRVSLVNGAPLYLGDFVFRPALLTDPGAVALRDGEGALKGAPDKGPSFRVKGKFEARHGGVTFPSYRLETGTKEKPYYAEGSGMVAFGASPRFDFLADGAQVTFSDEDASGGAAGSLSERLGAVEAFLKTIPVPSMPGEIKLALPAIVAGDTTIRDIALTASPGGGAWDVKSFSAALPGRTKLEASGRLGLGKEFGFSGDMLLASNQPTGLAVWLTGGADTSVRQLAAFGLAAKVNLTRARQSFENTELTLGNTTLKGQFTRRGDGATPSLAASFDGGAVSLDELSALTFAMAGGKGAGLLAGHDLDVSLKAGPVSALGMEAEALDAAVRLRGGKLDIDRFLVTGLGGASISATSDLSGFPAAPEGTVDMSVLSQDAAELFGLLGEKFPGMPLFAALSDRAALYPQLLADAKIDLVTSFAQGGGLRRQTLSLSASAGGGIYSGSATVSGDLTDLKSLSGKGALQGHHEDPLAVMALIGAPVLPIGAPGPLTFDVSAEGGGSEGFSLSASAKSDNLTAAASGRFTPGADGLEGTGEVSLKSADIEPYMMAAGVTFPDMGQGLSADLKSGFVKSASAVRFGNLQGTVSDIAASGDITLDIWQSAPRATGRLTLSSADLGWLGELALGQGSLASSIDGWPQGSFSPEGMAPLQASLDIEAKSMSLRGLGEVGEVKTLLVFDKSALGLRGFSGNYAGGVLSGSGEVKNDKGTALVTGEFRLSGARIEALAPQESVQGAADLSGSLTATGKSAAGIMASLTGAGVAKGADVSIKGVNPGGLAGIMAETENAGLAPDGASVEKSVAKSMAQGALRLAETNLSWTAASGIVRFSPIIENVGDATLSAAATADFGRQSASVNGKLAFAAADGAAGAPPEIPFSVTLDGGIYASKFDAQPLEQFLGQRALEREQARVEALQEELLEGQRLRREVRLYTFRQRQREAAELSKRVAADEIRIRALTRAMRARAAEEEAKRQAGEAEAAQKAGEAALAPKPALPRINLDADLLNGQNSAGDLLQQFRLDPAPIQ